MLIHSDWHIHSDASYDSSLPLSEIAEKSAGFGFTHIGITDHLNYNDTKFLQDLEKSIAQVTAFQKEHPHFVLGVELTPIAQPEFDYIAKTGTRDGFIPPVATKPYGIALPLTKEELKNKGIRYAIGASHWRVDVPDDPVSTADVDGNIKEWYRQQMWLACDERVTVLGHPWYSPTGMWYEDFTIIPHSMNLEIAAALKENGKYVECNSHFFKTKRGSEKFKYQYAEFLRELHEMGIPVTYGSDAHNAYGDPHIQTEQYLLSAGFVDGDIVEIAEKDFWL